MLHKLPKTSYSLDSSSPDVNIRVITNIFTRISLNRNVGSNRFSVVTKYTIKDGDTPESIAEEIYGNVSYWWLVLVVNPQIKSMSDWPKTDRQLDEYLSVNFGDRINETVTNGETDFDQPFFVDGELIEYSSFSPDDQFETTDIFTKFREDNDNKRIINLVTPELLPDFVQEYNRAIDNYKNEIQQNTIL